MRDRERLRERERIFHLLVHAQIATGLGEAAAKFQEFNPGLPPGEAGQGLEPSAAAFHRLLFNWK